MALSKICRPTPIRLARPQPLSLSLVRTYADNQHSRFNDQHSYKEEKEQWQYRPNGSGDYRVKLLAPTIWALVFSAGAFVVCAESFASHRKQFRESGRNILDILGLGMRGYDDESDQIWKLMNDAQVQMLVGRAHDVSGVAHARAIRRIAHMPSWVPFEVKRSMVIAADKWHRLSRGEKCVYTIAGINAVVFGMWQIPRLLPFMARTFLHDPRSGLSYTMLTSTFSHREVWHLLFNSIALVSFGTTVADVMGAEQFTAFYLSAGVVSSLASHLLAPLRPALLLPSLGASGAVYSVIGATMMMFPRAKIALIFLPFLPFTISQGFPALMAYDFLGAALGWRTFNHVAHLGGGLYGIAYVEWCSSQWSRLVRFVEKRKA
ncbi:hypothetical protein GGI15_000393 [Coemansia interrupta]|uniref:Peptidase S54 rhomboid domain-containing protein n=1 Tax=Coemansia interrupta TaxID=1126814 RepID=A0A9W8HN89_9FUNG|nr:hypothetical protein GGI15_000393 [Coemansia interrupta]